MRTTRSLAAAWILALASALVLAAPAPAAAPAASPEVTVYKTPKCGCCNRWIDHLRAAGFRVKGENLADLSMLKQMHRVPRALEACHTALVGGYVVEGHVPAADVARLLAERPKVLGIAVPGMPIGSPGMEGGTPEPYDVVTFDRAGATAVFARHR
jgi:hypothetical protein